MSDLTTPRALERVQPVHGVPGPALGAHLRALADVGHFLDSAADPATLAEQAVLMLHDVFGYRYPALYCLDETDQALRLQAAAWNGRHPTARQAEGIPAWVADRREAVLVPDVRSDARYRAHPDLPETASEMAVPLLAADRLLGVLDVRSDVPGALTETDLLILQAVADRVAAVIENARFRAQITELLDETRQRLDEVSTLYLIGNEITSSLQLDEVLEVVVDVVRRALHCRGCCIFLLDRTGEALDIRAASGLKPEWRQTARLALGEGIAGRVAATVQSYYVPDTLDCAEYVVFDPEVRCLLAVPLQARGRVIGVLNIDHSAPNAFGPTQERLLNVAASQVAVAIDNARLYSEVVAEKHYKEEFLSIVSHEFRTPLACIRGYVNLMLEDEVPDPQTRREFLEIVQRQTERFILLVNNLLNVAQLDGVALELSPRPLRLTDLVEQAVHKLRGLAAEKSIELITGLPAGLPNVLGDHNWLEQVISNLIHNAIKYTPNGGRVTASVRLVECEVWVEVSDTGVGIPPAAQEQLFTKFYRVPDQTGQRPAGTGLGLHIARKIVVAHSGRIWVESIPGEGSIFRFALPVAEN